MVPHMQACMAPCMCASKFAVPACLTVCQAHPLLLPDRLFRPTLLLPAHPPTSPSRPVGPALLPAAPATGAGSQMPPDDIQPQMYMLSQQASICL